MMKTNSICKDKITKILWKQQNFNYSEKAFGVGYKRLFKSNLLVMLLGSNDRNYLKVLIMLTH